jgi:hypothetical protein
LADHADKKPPSCVPLLDWLKAPPTIASDDSAPLSDSDAEREARNDRLTEPLEQLRRRRQRLAENAGYARLLARYRPVVVIPGTITEVSAEPLGVTPLDPELARMFQALARLRGQYKSGAIRLWGHYGRRGRELAELPFAPIDQVDLNANRLRLLGDPDWWCSMEVQNRPSATPDATPPTLVTSSEPGSSELDWREVVDQEMQWRKRHNLLQGGVVKLAKCLHAWLQWHGIKAPETAKTVEHYIRPFYQKHGESARRGPRPRGN